MKKKVAIIGGGACALMLGCELDPEKFEVSIYESNSALGRKFLVAGDGGLNLTHSENENNFIERYTPKQFLKKVFSHFSNKHFIQWLNENGIETFVGSSGRIFPVKGMKPVEVLNILLEKIKRNSVSVYTKHEWKGFSKNNGLLFQNTKESIEVKSDIVIFSLGGASWPVTGSNGNWIKFFEGKTIQTLPFIASNCAFKVDWDKGLIPKIEGKALKNISVTCGTKTHLGEIVLTKFGIEGSGIYPLSPQIRKELQAQIACDIYIDLKPNVTIETLEEKITKILGEKGFTENLKTHLNFSQAQIQLLKVLISKEDFLDPKRLSHHIKQLQLKITGLAPIDDAISTVGGISLTEINENFELKKLKAHYCIGEMLDYDAPTGGYLLQSCFSMGHYLAHFLNENKTNY